MTSIVQPPRGRKRPRTIADELSSAHLPASSPCDPNLTTNTTTTTATTTGVYAEHTPRSFGAAQSDPFADMNYLNMTSVPGANGPAPNGNLYGADPTMTIPNTQAAEDYRNQVTAGAHPVANMYDGQVQRVPRASQLVRMPSFGGMPGAGIPGGIPPNVSNMTMNSHLNMMPAGLMQPTMPYGPPQPDGLDRKLYAEIDKMKKKRSSIPPFVLKLSSFVNDPKTDHLIRWSPSGNSFMVLDEDEFSKTLIPDLFKHNNYASFVRQLNMYGFHKVVGLADGSLKTSEARSKPPSEYENPYFKRGQPDLMWLIQKPKSKKASGGRGKKAKQEEPDTDKEDGGSDAERGGDNENAGYLEGPHKDSGHSNHSRMDMQALVNQIEAVRNHQAMISAAIQRLRKDHQQLYEQSLAFQSLHDRHENSINAILTFLATVYDKSLAGAIPPAVNQLFSHQVEQGQPLHRTPTNPPPHPGAIITQTPRTPHQALRTPTMSRRRPLLLEGGPALPPDPHFPLEQQHSPPTTIKSPPHPPAVQELFTPSPSHSTPDPLFTPPPYPSHPSTPSLRTNAQTLAKALSTNSPLAGSAQAIRDHHASLAAKSREISELEELQARQVENMDHLMGMMRDYTRMQAPPPAEPAFTGDTSASTGSPDGQAGADVEQYLDFGFEGGEGVDIEELLRGVGVDGMSAVNGNAVNAVNGNAVNGVNGNAAQTGQTGQAQTGQTAHEVLGSPGRRREEEVVEEVAPKRRKVEQTVA